MLSDLKHLVDLFGILLESKEGHKMILFVEDCVTKRMELFPLVLATACECTTKLIEEVFLRYVIPRKLISDNGPLFMRAMLQ
ncbi:hypothetical protein CEXT_587031 [Caerostris extrusa]|uniref:Integrase catalytic domain-containing protein n=1 Tax=Caerostris extrusa TaxID=172846 RepID=A0AAV4N7K5_CAEEX|nr:hypothetical protein CEXT_587031 [Caerostris extrusa]